MQNKFTILLSDIRHHQHTCITTGIVISITRPAGFGEDVSLIRIRLSLFDSTPRPRECLRPTFCMYARRFHEPFLSTTSQGNALPPKFITRWTILCHLQVFLQCYCKTHAGAILRSVFYDTYFLVFITETVNHAYHSFTPIAFETTGVCGPCSVCFVTDLRHFWVRLHLKSSW